MDSCLPLLRPDGLFAVPWADEPLPVALVDLGREAEHNGLGDQGEPCALPPFPVIGLGKSSHPLAARLDTIVADPAEAALIARNCRANPEAAAVLVQLLRMIGGLPLADALAAESMAYGLLQAGQEHRRWRAARPTPPADGGAPGQVRAERNGDSLAVRMDRPAQFNAIDRPMRDALREAFDIAALDPDLRQITLTGTGRAFSVGADLAEFGTTTDPLAAHAIRLRTLPAQALVSSRARFEARVHGACIGAGIELAAFADRLEATPSAWFQLPELAMGLIPGAGGCVSLTRRIGRALTVRMVLTGRRIPARIAADWGLVDQIVPGWDQTLASGSPSA